MTDSMVERVARAIYAHAAEVGPHAVYETGVIDAYMEPLALARAAIEVMREPTQKMTDAVLLGDLDSWVIDDNWRAMIAAALAEPVPK